MSEAQIDLMTPVYMDLVNSVKHIGNDAVIAIDSLRILLDRWDREGWPETEEIRESLNKVLWVSDFERLLAPEPQPAQ